MTINQIEILLKKKTTTIEDILIQLSEMVQRYEEGREDYYIQQFGEAMQTEEMFSADIDIDQHTKYILDRVSKDTKEFIKNYTNNITDQVLDSINQKRIKKNPGFCFLTIVSAIKETFEVD